MIKKKFNKDKLKEIKMEPMDDIDISYYLPDTKNNIIEYNQLQKYNSIDDVLPSNNSYKLLLYEQENNVGHWVAIKRIGNDIYYFDSYGNKIDNPLNWSKDTNNFLGQDKKYLSDLFNKTDKDIYYNDIQYQGGSYDLATCGAHSINFIKSNLSLKDYYKMMKKLKNKNKMSFDDIVSSIISIR